jgi:hypothetical protein
MLTNRGKFFVRLVHAILAIRGAVAGGQRGAKRRQRPRSRWMSPNGPEPVRRRASAGARSPMKLREPAGRVRVGEQRRAAGSLCAGCAWPPQWCGRCCSSRAGSGRTAPAPFRSRSRSRRTRHTPAGHDYHTTRQAVSWRDLTASSSLGRAEARVRSDFAAAWVRSCALGIRPAGVVGFVRTRQGSGSSGCDAEGFRLPWVRSDREERTRRHLR